MNRTIGTLILAFSATLGVNSLQAAEKAVANIPFAFHVGKTAMPAGKYTVDRPVVGDSRLFSISDADGHSRYVGAPNQSETDNSDPKLTFVCLKGECSLAKIQTPGSNISYYLRLPNETRKVGMASMIAVRLSR